MMKAFPFKLGVHTTISFPRTYMSFMVKSYASLLQVLQNQPRPPRCPLATNTSFLRLPVSLLSFPQVVTAVQRESWPYCFR